VRIPRAALVLTGTFRGNFARFDRLDGRQMARCPFLSIDSRSGQRIARRRPRLRNARRAVSRRSDLTRSVSMWVIPAVLRSWHGTPWGSAPLCLPLVLHPMQAATAVHAQLALPIRSSAGDPGKQGPSYILRCNIALLVSTTSSPSSKGHQKTTRPPTILSFPPLLSSHPSQGH
jgi:hypothetical protein